MQPMFQRDLLYPTESIVEPGSVHVNIYNPNSQGKMPVEIESKTNHSPIQYLDVILRIMQSEIFDRILLNVKANTTIYIKSTEEIKKEYGCDNYVVVRFDKDEKVFACADTIHIGE